MTPQASHLAWETGLCKAQLYAQYWFYLRLPLQSHPDDRYKRLTKRHGDGLGNI
jgi:hypothetical protein